MQERLPEESDSIKLMEETDSARPAPITRSTRLGAMLVDGGEITQQQLDQALTRQRETGQRVGEALAELGHVSSEVVSRTLAEQLGIPYVELNDEYQLDRAETELVPESLARRYGMIPIRKDGEGPKLTLVMGNPLDVEAIDLVRSHTHLDIAKAVGSAEEIQGVIDRSYHAEAHIESDLQDLIDLETNDVSDGLDDSQLDAEQLRVFANDAPVVRFVNLILMEGVRDGASDIHFEPGEKDVTVRFRIDGLLREVPPPPKTLYQAVVTRIKIMSKLDIAERRLPLDGRFRFTVKDHVVDVRVSTLPEIYGEKIVLRLLDQGSVKIDMREIGFPEHMLKRFQKKLRMPNGIILLTGPTGSGKTTTLYSALNYLKSPDKNIQTVEDPVEYQLAGLNQMAIRPEIGLDFARALRSILRQDPDVVLIGEIRDVETARIAMRASLTGHLVLSTLHTNDATSAFNRLQDIGVEPYLIAATVKLVISQRLIRVICPDCKEQTEPDPVEVDQIRSLCPDIDSWTFRRGAGCKKCGHSGFKGRNGIFEFLEVGSRLKDLFQAGASVVDLRRAAIEDGMETLALNGFNRVRDGLTTMEEVISVAQLEDIVEDD